MRENTVRWKIIMNGIGKVHPPVTLTKQEVPGDLKESSLQTDARNCCLQSSSDLSMGFRSAQKGDTHPE